MKWIFFSGLAFLFVGCNGEPVSIMETTPYVETIPSHFPYMQVSTQNPTTNEGVALGRMLYYDNKLHPNQAMSCSQCHDQSNAFTDPVVNSLAHINIGWSSTFLWNGKVEGTLEDIMMFEVDEFFHTDLSVLNNDDEYPIRFERVFGVTTIESKHVAYALAQFFRTLNSYDSKYDRVLQGLETFTAAEANGYDIFFSERGDCFHCHGGALTTDNLMHNNGLDAMPDDGRFTITNNPADKGKFKTPTLRNIEYTSPYMHDGRYQTLEEVLTFYCWGLQDSPTIDPLMKNVGFPGGIDLNQQDFDDLISFLKTLSDESFLTNESLSDPF
ncbi:MAG: cytochrome c peroxidase [Crocinitomicaceae bacterium]|nr:cytochrome c peroxidase [Crocinitomicaceae bacterium]